MNHYKITLQRAGIPVESHSVDAPNEIEARRMAYEWATEDAGFDGIVIKKFAVPTPPGVKALRA